MLPKWSLKNFNVVKIRKFRCFPSLKVPFFFLLASGRTVSTSKSGYCIPVKMLQYEIPFVICLLICIVDSSPTTGNATVTKVYGESRISSNLFDRNFIEFPYHPLSIQKNVKDLVILACARTSSTNGDTRQQRMPVTPSSGEDVAETQITDLILNLNVCKRVKFKIRQQV